MNCPNEIIEYMHDYLDEEITAENEKQLRLHLEMCEDCQRHFHELKKAIALVQSTSHVHAPSDFTAKVMAKLPKEKKKVGLQRWFRNHPVITAAALFLILMTGSLMSTWNENKQFSVSKNPNLVIENNTAIVPKGKVVHGDIVVKNGDIKIEGEVNGDVTLINGEKYLASAGQVTGEIREINEVFDWIWYHIKNTGKDVINIFSNDEKKDSHP